jgi:2,4-didehydro-3-deoxy-L-rhamnonate hydrolase
MPVPEEPILFGKASSSVCGPDDNLIIPPGATKTDWEIELGIIIGVEAKYLRSEEEASRHIAGYCLVNDVSEREHQLQRGGQWIKGKSAENFNPMGPWIVTEDEIPDLSDIDLHLTVNGTSMQKGSTRDMVHGPHALVEYISQFMVLEPGDLINTGTPAGVGMGRDPEVYLKEGDTVILEAKELGKQQQTCRPAFLG